MEQIVLVGDSVFDNQTYVGDDPDVIAHLRGMMPKDWTATLCAVDGSTTETLPAQVGRIPKDATYIVASVGGNDALGHLALLFDDTQSGASLLQSLAEIGEDFAGSYNRAILGLQALGKPMCLCTIYNGNLAEELSGPAQAAVAVFNDKIYMVANELGLPVLELRRICTEPSDYANPIEPSSKGGAKIAKAILLHIRSSLAHRRNR